MVGHLEKKNNRGAIILHLRVHGFTLTTKIHKVITDNVFYKITAKLTRIQ